MSNYDDEFKDVKKRLPTESSTQKARFSFVLLFTVLGVIFAVLILLFQDTISSEGKRLVEYGYVPEQVILNGLLSLAIGSLQAWIFRSKIVSRIYVFIGFTLLGGIVGGLAGGLLKDAGIYEPIVLGVVCGGLAGGISSYAQNIVMRNQKYANRWLLYSIFSWAAIYAIGWAIGLSRDATNIALAAGFLMIASGVSLAVFLNNTPQIEFS